jgi:hypothetical protein
MPGAGVVSGCDQEPQPSLATLLDTGPGFREHWSPLTNLDVEKVTS